MTFSARGIDRHEFDTIDQLLASSRVWARGMYAIWSDGVKVGSLEVTDTESHWYPKAESYEYVPTPYKPAKGHPPCFAMYNPKEVAEDKWEMSTRNQPGTSRYIISRALKDGYHEHRRETLPMGQLTLELLAYAKGAARLEVTTIKGRKGGDNAIIVHWLVPKEA